MCNFYRVFMQKSLIGWLLLFIVLPSVPSFGEGVNSAEQLAVFDTNNKRVGRVIGIDGSIPKVALEVNGLLFPVGVVKAEFAGTFPIWFDSVECTGSPFMTKFPEGFGSAFSTIAGVSGENEPFGNIVYIPNLDEVEGSVEYKSFRSGTACNFASGTINNVVPAIPLVDLDDFFTPPLTVKPEKDSLLQRLRRKLKQ